MFSKRRYSIRFLFFEIFLFGCAFALMREGLVRGGDGGTLFVVASIVAIGAATGGLFGSWARGLMLSVGTFFSIGFFVSLLGELLGFVFGLLFVLALAVAREGDRRIAARRTDAFFRRLLCPSCSVGGIDPVGDQSAGLSVRAGRCRKCGREFFFKDGGQLFRPFSEAS